MKSIIHRNRVAGLTFKQECFLWRAAWHANAALAYRECYRAGNKSSNVGSVRLMQQEHLARRLEKLVKAHREGVIDLSTGPWEFYGKPTPGHVDLGAGQDKISPDARPGTKTKVSLGQRVLNRLTSGAGVSADDRPA